MEHDPDKGGLGGLMNWLKKQLWYFKQKAFWAGFWSVLAPPLGRQLERELKEERRKIGSGS